MVRHARRRGDGVLLSCVPLSVLATGSGHEYGVTGTGDRLCRTGSGRVRSALLDTWLGARTTNADRSAIVIGSIVGVALVDVITIASIDARSRSSTAPGGDRM